MQYICTYTMLMFPCMYDFSPIYTLNNSNMHNFSYCCNNTSPLTRFKFQLPGCINCNKSKLH